jgi:hypothetical protein
MWFQALIFERLTTTVTSLTTIGPTIRRQRVRTGRPSGKRHGLERDFDSFGEESRKEG